MITSMHFGASKATFQFADYLRNNMTSAEKMLWFQVSKNALGYKFRNQHPVWRYVVDFYCHPVKLVIEVDGTIHTLEDNMLNDADRTQNLLSLGLNLIRFTNDQVLYETDTVISEIKKTIAQININRNLIEEV